jgi:quercetin dioxygenase-like cupin family protein
MARDHQPGESAFRSILPEDIDWKPFAAFPPSVRLAVVVGDPSKPGPYVIRVKAPSGVKLMPHRHPEDRIYTVISGVFYIGLGEEFNAEDLRALPPGSVVVLPGDTWHFHWAKSGEYGKLEVRVIQTTRRRALGCGIAGDHRLSFAHRPPSGNDRYVRIPAGRTRRQATICWLRRRTSKFGPGSSGNDLRPF